MSRARSGAIRAGARVVTVTRRPYRIAKLEVLAASLGAELEAERQAHEMTRTELFKVRAVAAAAEAERSRRWLRRKAEAERSRRWRRRKGT